MTVGDGIVWGIKILEERGITSPQLNAELILMSAAGMSRLDLLLHKEQELSEEHTLLYETLVRLRAGGEPLQYVLGEVPFYNIHLSIDASALIPRPETEELVSNILKQTPAGARLNILDIGTGSGCIALALGKSLPLCNVLGIDISGTAIELAEYNRSTLAIENVHFRCISLAEYITLAEAADVIVSNPPYIPLVDYVNLEPELYREPRMALTDEADGFTYYNVIADGLSRLLKPDGVIYFECGIRQAETIAKIYEQLGYSADVSKDFAGIERFIKIYK